MCRKGSLISLQALLHGPAATYETLASRFQKVCCVTVKCLRHITAAQLFNLEKGLDKVLHKLASEDLRFSEPAFEIQLSVSIKRPCLNSFVCRLEKALEEVVALAPEPHLTTQETLSTFTTQMLAACDENEVTIALCSTTSMLIILGATLCRQQPHYGHVLDGPCVPEDSEQLAHLPRNRAGYSPHGRQGVIF